jgi:hypothetical protein
VWGLVEEVALGTVFPTVLPFFLPVIHIQIFSPTTDENVSLQLTPLLNKIHLYTTTVFFLLSNQCSL